MKILDARATEECLPYDGLADALEQVLRDGRAGRAYAPLRLSMPLPGEGSLLLMPATDGEITITKLVTVHPGNPQRDIASVQAEVIVMDAATGERLFILDGGVVTARRTSALSLLAARRLAARIGPMFVVGAGVQARAHVEAFAEGLGVREVYILSRTAASAEDLAVHARSLGLLATPISDAEEALDRATLIVTATTSREPVLTDGVRDDAFIAAVGAYTPEMAELPVGLVRRSWLYVDTLEGARAGAGDFIRAGVDWEAVISLEEALDRTRPEGKTVIFKSVGHALWDLAAARLAYKSLLKS